MGDAAAGPWLIVGQGLAGSLVGWWCERRGIDFRIIDAGHAAAASRVGAGLVSPLTGRRLAPTWRFGEWSGEARAVYEDLGRQLGIELVAPLSIHRLRRGLGEAAGRAARRADPAVARWLGAAGPEGLWVEGAWRVNTAALVAGLRERWLAQGRLLEGRLSPDDIAAWPGPPVRVPPVVVWCVGAATAPGFEAVPWEVAKGQILTATGAGVPEGRLVHDGHWVLGASAGVVRVGATYERGQRDAEPTEDAKRELLDAARRLTGTAVVVSRHEAAVRVTVPDRRPVVGWHPRRPGWGILAGLASKGALWAPVLARQLVEAEGGGAAIDPAASVERFFTAGPA